MSGQSVDNSNSQYCQYWLIDTSPYKEANYGNSKKGKSKFTNTTLNAVSSHVLDRSNSYRWLWILHQSKLTFNIILLQRTLSFLFFNLNTLHIYLWLWKTHPQDVGFVVIVSGNNPFSISRCNTCDKPAAYRTIPDSVQCDRLSLPLSDIVLLKSVSRSVCVTIPSLHLVWHLFSLQCFAFSVAPWGFLNIIDQPLIQTILTQHLLLSESWH